MLWAGVGSREGNSCFPCSAWHVGNATRTPEKRENDENEAARTPEKGENHENEAPRTPEKGENDENEATRTPEKGEKDVTSAPEWTMHRIQKAG